MKCIFTIDVEDWFHILDLPSTPDIDQWDSLPSRVETNFVRLLDIVAEYDVVATCFFLGWVAERFPHLVREAVHRGHEIASHGYAHRLVYRMNRAEFYEDALRSRKTLEDIAGAAIAGYRATGFSTTERTPWFFEAVSDAGYHYDSSVFPAARGHGGMRSGELAPHSVPTPNGNLIEFPISVAPLLGRPMCFFGGGYLRLFPYRLVRRKAVSVLQHNRPVVFYVHPREIDPEHPRLPMGAWRRFKSYVNLTMTERKVRNLLSDFEFTTFRGYLSEMKQAPEMT